MRIRRMFVLTLAAVVAASMAVLMAQAPSGATPSITPNLTDTDAAIKAAADVAKREAATKNYTAPRTPWGDPDLRGVYLTATYTPLQRPPALANKPFYTEEEAVAEFKRAVEADAEVDPRTVHYDWKEYSMDAWQGGRDPTCAHRSSSILPTGGSLRSLLRRKSDAKPVRQQPSKGTRRPASRRSAIPIRGAFLGLARSRSCGAAILVPNRLRAAGVTAEVQIFQSPGFVTLVKQSNNDVRIIPVDGRPHLSTKVRHWFGDSAAGGTGTRWSWKRPTSKTGGRRSISRVRPTPLRWWNDSHG